MRLNHQLEKIIDCKVLHFINNEDQEALDYKTLRCKDAVAFFKENKASITFLHMFSLVFFYVTVSKISLIYVQGQEKRSPKDTFMDSKKTDQNFCFFLKPRQIKGVEQVSSLSVVSYRELSRIYRGDIKFLNRSTRCRGGVEIAIRKSLEARQIARCREVSSSYRVLKFSTFLLDSWTDLHDFNT